MSDHKSPDAYDKLSDTLDKKLLDFNIGMLKVVAAMLVRPLAMCTEPFFRKNFGERYFTENTFIVSMGIWAVGAELLNFLYPPQPTPLQNWLFYHANLQKLADELRARNFVGVVCFIYSYMAFKQLVVTRMRQRAGQIWHSMSRGESLFGTENTVRDMIIAALIAGFLWIAAPHLCAIFLFSLIASYYLQAKQQSSVYSRYLDAMDAKIEAEHFQRTLEKGEPPKDTDGLYGPLPKRFKGEYRTRVARVAAGGPFDPNAPDQRQAITRAASVASVSPVQTPPDGSQPSPSFTGASDKAKEILTSKQFITLAVVTLIIAVCAYAGSSLYRVFASREKPKVVAPMPVVQPAQQAVIPTPSPPTDQTAPVVENPVPEPPPVQAAAHVVAPSPPPVDTAALALAALKKQREEEQQKAAQQRQNTIDQFYKTLSEKTAELAKLQTDTQAQLDANTNKIAKVSWLRRTSLRHQNEKNRLAIQKALLTQQQSLNLVGDSIRVYAANTNDDPSQVTGDFQIYDQTQADISGKIKTIMDAMDDAISGNDGNSGIIQIR